MSISISRDALLERVSAGERLSADDIHHLAATPDILSIGMLADALRRRLHDTRTTFLRVAECALEAPSLESAQVNWEAELGKEPDWVALSVLTVAPAWLVSDPNTL